MGRFKMDLPDLSNLAALQDFSWSASILFQIREIQIIILFYVIPIR